MIKLFLFAGAVTGFILWLSGWHPLTLLVAGISALAWGFSLFWQPNLDRVTHTIEELEKGNIW